MFNRGCPVESVCLDAIDVRGGDYRPDTTVSSLPKRYRLRDRSVRSVSSEPVVTMAAEMAVDTTPDRQSPSGRKRQLDSELYDSKRQMLPPSQPEARYTLKDASLPVAQLRGRALLIYDL